MSDSNKPLDKKDEKRLKTRGKGTGVEYQPFVFIHELSSAGESVRAPGLITGRVHHLLSGLELAAFMIFDWNPNTVDIREQYPLPIEDTITLSEQLGLKHPQFKGKLRVVTTDLLCDFQCGKRLAIAVKSLTDLKDLRVREKLQLERSYWEAQGVEWRLFTDLNVPAPLKQNLQWIRTVLLEEELASDNDYSEVPDLLKRLLPLGDVSVTKACGRLDDQYGLEPGSHIRILRRGVARKWLKTPLLKPYHQWFCSDISLGLQAARAGVQCAN